MARTLTAAVTTAVTSQALTCTWALDLVLDSGTLRMWGGIGPTTIGGNTYTGLGTLGTITAVEETTDVTKATGMRFTLSGVDSAMISVALSEHYQGRTARAYAVFFDASMVAIADPVLMFAGRIDVMQITDAGNSCVIEGTAESRAIALDRPSEVRYYTDADQQRYFSGDLGLQYVAGMVNQEIFWGKVQPGASGSVAVIGGGGDGGGYDGGSAPEDSGSSEPGQALIDYDGGNGDGGNGNWQEYDWGG